VDGSDIVLQEIEMAIFDISLTISPGLPVWPGDPAIQLQQVSFMDKGDVCNVSYLAMGVHAGTHVDAPHHFLNDKRTVENLDLDVMTGQAFLIEFGIEVNAISFEILDGASIPVGVERLLIKTRNSEIWARGENKFIERFVAIVQDGAEWLVQRGIKLVGVDYLSVAPFGEGVPTHRILLEAGIIALEGLNLSSVSHGYYELYCLPLKLKGSDGAPARVILKK
jgi:arylformamidase